MKSKILIVDDDSKIASLLSDVLKENDLRPSLARTTEEAWSQVELGDPDLILLDVEIPMKGGLEFCREIKSKDAYRHIPIIFLTVRDQEVDRVAALTMGGDDFIVKPFRPRELVARISVALRRSAGNQPPPTTIKAGPLYIDMDRRVVKIHRKEVHLTPKELELLTVLYSNRHRVMSEKMIFDQIWGAHCSSMLSTVYTHIERLRKKLGEHGIKIKTVPGTGFRFEERAA
ncbi:MAG: response regulator transcription factor [Elusimicrobia bacterium]|nr:response regulator transcription factor [Elusimicrobiota bacterium]